MTGERSYTTKIWRQPSSIGFSSADALSTSMDPPGEPVISTRKRPCQKIQNGSEFPELGAQNSRNPQEDQRNWNPPMLMARASRFSPAELQASTGCWGRHWLRFFDNKPSSRQVGVGFRIGQSVRRTPV